MLLCVHVYVYTYTHIHVCMYHIHFCMHIIIHNSDNVGIYVRMCIHIVYYCVVL